MAELSVGFSTAKLTRQNLILLLFRLRNLKDRLPMMVKANVSSVVDVCILYKQAYEKCTGVCLPNSGGQMSLSHGAAKPLRTEART